MKKHFERFMWTICAIAIAALILTDPIAVAWLLENITVIALWALSVAVCGVICWLTGLRQGKRIGHFHGYAAGAEWEKLKK